MAMIPQSWTISGLSVELGITRRTVAKRIKDVTPAGENGRGKFYRMADVIPVIYQVNNGQDGAFDSRQEKAKLDRARRIHEEIKIEQLRGELISRKQVEEESNRNCILIRNRIMGLSNRLATMLETAGSYGERFALIDTEIRSALEALADIYKGTDSE